MQKEDGKWMRFCENKFAFHDNHCLAANRCLFGQMVSICIEKLPVVDIESSDAGIDLVQLTMMQWEMATAESTNTRHILVCSLIDILKRVCSNKKKKNYNFI